MCTYHNNHIWIWTFIHSYNLFGMRFVIDFGPDPPVKTQSFFEGARVLPMRATRVWLFKPVLPTLWTMPGVRNKTTNRISIFSGLTNSSNIFNEIWLKLILNGTRLVTCIRNPENTWTCVLCIFWNPGDMLEHVVYIFTVLETLDIIFCVFYQKGARREMTQNGTMFAPSGKQGCDTVDQR